MWKFFGRKRCQLIRDRLYQQGQLSQLVDRFRKANTYENRPILSSYRSVIASLACCVICHYPSVSKRLKEGRRLCAFTYPGYLLNLAQCKRSHQFGTTRHFAAPTSTDLYHTHRVLTQQSFDSGIGIKTRPGFGYEGLGICGGGAEG